MVHFFSKSFLFNRYMGEASSETLRRVKGALFILNDLSITEWITMPQQMFSGGMN